MFEKEAEEYREKEKDKGYYWVTQEMEQSELDTIIDESFKDGAEFGYNKAKIEVEESYRESLCNSELNLASVTEQLEELEKANEWHYVKNKDYPKDNKSVLCILGDIDSDNCEVGYYNDVGSGEPWHFETYHLPDDDGDNAWEVSAWKEIVIPELKEDE